MASTNQQEKRRLNEEEMTNAVKQIVFDLGVSSDQARQWAEEAQERLQEEDKLVTKQVVVVAADTEHVDDEDVPAEFKHRSQEAPKFTDQVKRIVHAVANRS